MSRASGDFRVAPPGWLALSFAALAIAAAAPAQAATAFLSDALVDVPAENRAAVANPQPVQLIFQFETKGAPNARATKYLIQHVIDDLKATGAFSQIASAPTANGAILSITIDNAATPEDMENATRQGVVTGATLFIAGSSIVDHYHAKVEYVASPTAPRITRTAEQAIITQMGLINSPPPHAVKVGALDQAVFEMVKQVIDNPLNDIVKDPAFSGAASPATPAPPASPAAAAPADTSASPASAPAAAPSQP